jgi:hypothetical protein
LHWHGAFGKVPLLSSEFVGIVPSGSVPDGANGMFSAMASVGIGIVVYGVAVHKGRTGWHWFALTVFAFAAVWLASYLVLYFANVQISPVAADKSLAGFAGAVTCAVMVVVLLYVPYRPRRHAVPLEAARRGPSSS